MSDQPNWLKEAIADVRVWRSDLLIGLPFTPQCRHGKPHPPRIIEDEDELSLYLTFVLLGWEGAGYCWSYVPAFLHEWFGCGPSQKRFVAQGLRARADLDVQVPRVL